MYIYTSAQGCIICAILPSGMGARGVSSEHVENMEMFSCSPTLIGALWFSENLIRYSLHITFVDVWIKIFIARLFREVKNSFFPSDTLIYGISRDGSKNIRTCEHMFLGQLKMGACQAKNAPLGGTPLSDFQNFTFLDQDPIWWQIVWLVNRGCLPKCLTLNIKYHLSIVIGLMMIWLIARRDDNPFVHWLSVAEWLS